MDNSAPTNTQRWREWKRKKRAEKEATYDARREKALTEGKRMEYLVCPICGLNRPTKRERGPPKFLEATLDTFLIQVRYGGGPGIGYFLKEEESITLEHAKEHYPEHYEALKKAVAHLNALLVEM